MLLYHNIEMQGNIYEILNVYVRGYIIGLPDKIQTVHLNVNFRETTFLV